MNLRTPAVLFLGCWIVAVAGCSGPPAPLAVTGTVTFDGLPVPEGMILFEPVDETAGQRRDATIKDGNFSLPAEEGLLPHLEFQVIIKGFKKTGRKYPSPDPNETFEEVVQYLPAQYNAASMLRVTISPDDEENRFDFDLKSTAK